MLQRTIDILRTDLDQLADDWVRAMNASLPPESRKAVPVGELVERARTVIDGAILGLAGEDSTEFRVGGEAFAAAVKLGQLGKDCGYELDHVIRPFALLRQRVLELLGGNLRQGDAGPLCTAARLDSSLDQLLLWTADAFLNARIQELQRQAITDGLTGTFTHDHFLRRLEEEMERSRRYGQPVTLLMADLDTLKVINDRFGHLSGDEVLRQVADLLVNTCRRVDVVARYGGDEFGIILPQTDSEGAKKLAKRIVQGVASNVHLSKQEDFVTTISVGLAAYPQDADTPRALTEAADRAMYRAKAAGGNMVCWDDGALAPSDSSAQGEHSRSLTMQFRGVLRELVDRLERENREMEESLAEVQHRLDAHERHEAAIQDTVAEMIAGVIPPARRDKKPSQEGEAENEPSAVLLAVAERTNDLCRTVEGWTEDSLSAVPGIGAAVPPELKDALPPGKAARNREEPTSPPLSVSLEELSRRRIDLENQILHMLADLHADE